MPDDLLEQRYRLAAAECLEAARLASDQDARATFLSLAQKWLELANDRFGMNTFNRDQFSALVAGFNDDRLREP